MSFKKVGESPANNSQTSGENKATGSMRGRNVKVGSSVSIAGIMFVAGIVLWAVGASIGNPSMVLAGKILFGLSFAPIALSIVLCCGTVCCYCCAKKALKEVERERQRLQQESTN